MVKSGKWVRSLLVAALCFSLGAGAFAETGTYTDEEGGVWDYDMGIYTDAEGNQYEITDDSGNSYASSSGAGSRQNADGSITIVTGEEDSVVQNSDGSLTVDSGAIQVVDQKEESKPLTYEEWQARMDSIADRNGRVTETFYRKSENEMIPVNVVYVGLVRERNSWWIPATWSGSPKLLRNSCWLSSMLPRTGRPRCARRPAPNPRCWIPAGPIGWYAY